jgi:hypothetical protein
MKRVAASIDKIQSKLFVDKYGDQFNYLLNKWVHLFCHYQKLNELWLKMLRDLYTV